ncbi:hypothetical protein HK101_008534 [Irineochytrium annulatum]|nr:hypothetical protein HK101_008534 [Irineochytrium annulatum]
MILQEWEPSWFLRESSPMTRPVAALIILNQPLPRMEHLKAAWNSTTVRLCSDGGANRLHDRLPSDAARAQFLPDRILGGLCSIRPDVRAFYESHNVPLTRDPDQDSSDLEKCVNHARSIEHHVPGSLVPHEGGALRTRVQALHELIVLGALGGRLDQIMNSIHMLYTMEEGRRVYLVSNESMAMMLRGGGMRHRIICRKGYEGPTCGLLPIGVDEAKVVTEGLRWNLGRHPFYLKLLLSFGSLVSTSNAFADADSDLAEVMVTTDKAIILTIECNFGLCVDLKRI